MLHITTTKNRIVIKGHAGVMTNDIDLVCAAVSGIWYAITEKMAKEQIEIKMHEEPGFTEILVTDKNEKKQKQAEMLIDTLVCGCNSIAEEFKENIFIKSD